MEEGTSREPSDCDGTEADDRRAAAFERDAIQWDKRQDCEVRQILDRIADKWSLLVISLLARRTLRFSELRREIDGISQRMLTLTLRHLERDGLISRTVYPVVPPRVDYELTDLGCTLLEITDCLVQWTETHQAEIAAARARYEAAEAAAAN
ncbi:winged helix-turn-helix transcriptional regulator [Desertimonas flava]|jgi:DNA-binding HxlR family transcriptional regulator|uniref:winged helix-turn-helix transcriptional regulator n=1 Tax=Desertimonas flava TaxID=2064846 RepID=UPI000E3483E8|nr:helix-turn-helix domain-containing protein [Desertimonas flava]